MSVFERHPKLTAFVLVVVFTLATDFGFTAAYLWLRDRRTPEDGPEIHVADPVYDHGLRPGARSDDERWGTLVCTYRVNALGFRDRRVRDVPLAADHRRIVFIGDSFTEGMGYSWDQTFVGRVEAALAPSGVETLNAGVASYCPIIYDRKIRHFLDTVGLRFDSLVVLIDIGDVQDEVMYKFDERGNVIPRRARREIEGRANRRYHDPVFGRLHLVERFLQGHALGLATLYEWAHGLVPRPGARAALWTVDDAVYREYGREGLETAARHMDELHAALRRHGVDLTVAVYPWPDQIRVHDVDSRQSRFWREWCAARGARFVDLFPRFAGGAPDAIVRRYYIPGDIHWNADGHRLVADGLLEALAPGR